MVVTLYRIPHQREAEIDKSAGSLTVETRETMDGFRVTAETGYFSSFK